MKMQFTPVERRRSYLYPAETSLYLQLLHQLSSLANAHGAVHWGVSFHPDHKHSHISEILKIPFGPLMRHLYEEDQLVSTFDLALVKMIKICPLCWVFISRWPLNCQWSLGLNRDKIHIIVIICHVKKGMLKISISHCLFLDFGSFGCKARKAWTSRSPAIKDTLSSILCHKPPHSCYITLSYVAIKAYICWIKCKHNMSTGPNGQIYSPWPTDSPTVSNNHRKNAQYRME